MRPFVRRCSVSAVAHPGPAIGPVCGSPASAIELCGVCVYASVCVCVCPLLLRLVAECGRGAAAATPLRRRVGANDEERRRRGRLVQPSHVAGGARVSGRLPARPPARRLGRPPGRMGCDDPVGCCDYVLQCVRGLAEQKDRRDHTTGIVKAFAPSTNSTTISCWAIATGTPRSPSRTTSRL